jgi:hypothetical protein
MTSFLSALNCPTTLTSYFKCQVLAITVPRQTREALDPERPPRCNYSLKEMVPLGAIKPAAMQATVLENGVQNRKGMDPCGRVFLRVLYPRARNAVLCQLGFQMGIPSGVCSYVRRKGEFS